MMGRMPTPPGDERRILLLYAEERLERLHGTTSLRSEVSVKASSRQLKLLLSPRLKIDKHDGVGAMSSSTVDRA